MSVLEFLSKGGKVEDLLINGGDKEVSKEAFNEFLLGLISVNWNEAEMTKKQKEGLAKIKEYLKTSYIQEAQPINGKGVSISELVQSHKEADK